MTPAEHECASRAIRKLSVALRTIGEAKRSLQALPPEVVAGLGVSHLDIAAEMDRIGNLRNGLAAQVTLPPHQVPHD